MKKFNFNLESVLNYRLIMEQQAKEKFGQAKIYAAKQKELLEHYQTILLQEQENIADVADVSALQHRDMYVSCLCKQINNQAKVVEKAENLVKKRQAEVVKAMQDTKVLDNLKGKKYQEYLAEVNNEEQKILDEIGTINFTRHSSIIE
jgi:flagellar FliJ protein